MCLSIKFKNINEIKLIFKNNTAVLNIILNIIIFINLYKYINIYYIIMTLVLILFTFN